MSIALFTVGLVACGFHLRGNIPLPKTLSPMYISTTRPYDPLVQLIEDTLTASGITLTDIPKKASTILNIIDIQYAENLVSALTATNPLTIDSNQVLNASAQKQTQEQEMRQAVVQQLMIRLGSPNTKKALITNN
jgi:outer membrane lipopolysaccharide assembly protein LptE/RlpB